MAGGQTVTMSFKCSVFGHRYGDPDVEREREEQGSEVVITIKETETCKRCGETRVVSENKEVTTLETPSDIVGDDIGDGEDHDEVTAESEPVTEQEPDPPADPGGAVEQAEDTEFLDETEDSTPASPEPTEPDQPDLGTATEEAPDADEDDAVILNASDDEDDTREPGQWPDELDDETEADDEDSWSPSAEDELRPVEDEQPDIEPTKSAVTVPDGEFYCPECEFTTDVESSSLRAGDFCPECHRGSLTHRADES